MKRILRMGAIGGLVVACSGTDTVYIVNHDDSSANDADAGATEDATSSSAHDAHAQNNPIDSSVAKPDTSTPTPSDGFDQFQHRNLDDINKYRATLNIAPLKLDATLNTFALAGANELSQDHIPHQHFITASNNKTIWTSGFNMNAGENQGDPNGWTVLDKDPTQNELKQIDAIQLAMFNEGPGAGEAHGHYTNMMNAKFTRVGVGLLEVNNALYLCNDFSD